MTTVRPSPLAPKAQQAAVEPLNHANNVSNHANNVSNHANNVSMSCNR